MKSKKVKVSVIVPAYNAEPFLHRCIDSLVYQTLEDIEVIIVDNMSEDNTWRIMEGYRDSFPDKVRIFRLQKHFDGPGAGRNLGLKAAKAQYIGFADADDYFEYDALEKMYDKAESEKCDLVYCASYDVRNGEKRITRRLPHGTREEILTIGSMVFWNKLIHKGLFDILGKIPENMVFEDLAYCTGLVSRATKIGYIDEPLYYYIIREDSGVNTMDPDRVLKSIDADRIALSKCHPLYVDYFADSVAMRNCNNIRDRWQFSDSYIGHLKKIYDLYLKNNNYFLKDKRNYERVKNYLALPDEPIPAIIYMSGFSRSIPDGYIDNLEKNSFFYGAKVIVLNENNCDVSENEMVFKAYQEGNYEAVGYYFVLQNICKTGGVYIDPCIVLKTALNYTRYFEAFFSFLDCNEFSDKIFGAHANNDVIKEVLNRSEEFLCGSHTFKEVLSKILKNDYKVSMENKTELYKYNFAVFATCVFVIDDGARIHIAEHNFVDESAKDDFITVKKSTLLFK